LVKKKGEKGLFFFETKRFKKSSQNYLKVWVGWCWLLWWSK